VLFSVTMEFVDFLASFTFFFIFILTIVSTLNDFISKYFGLKSWKFFTIFSMSSNFKDLIVINKSESTIKCIDALKVLSAIWIIFGHRNDSFEKLSPELSIGKFVIYSIRGYFIAVETFLACSGILVTQSLLRAFERFENNNLILFKNFNHIIFRGKVNLAKIYLTRYLRFFALVSVLVLFQASSIPKSLVRRDISVEIQKCKKYWWSSLLFIQNYVNRDEICLGHTWYLSADFQMFLVSPLIVYFMWKFGWKSLSPAVALVLGLQWCTYINLSQ
jgi:peptidoglycan/LPS O-acetylase OafA/YrhL